MKIIKLPCETTVTCKKCGCVYEFNSEDIDIIKYEALDHTYNYCKIYVKCPFCGDIKEINILTHEEFPKNPYKERGEE